MKIKTFDSYHQIEILQIFNSFSIVQYWVLGHWGCEGNEAADGLARKHQNHSVILPKAHIKQWNTDQNHFLGHYS